MRRFPGDRRGGRKRYSTDPIREPTPSEKGQQSVSELGFPDHCSGNDTGSVRSPLGSLTHHAPLEARSSCELKKYLKYLSRTYLGGASGNGFRLPTAPAPPGFHLGDARPAIPIAPGSPVGPAPRTTSASPTAGGMALQTQDAVGSPGFHRNSYGFHSVPVTASLHHDLGSLRRHNPKEPIPVDRAKGRECIEQVLGPPGHETTAPGRRHRVSRLAQTRSGPKAPRGRRTPCRPTHVGPAIRAGSARVGPGAIGEETGHPEAARTARLRAG